jgi:hypothetical protein
MNKNAIKVLRMKLKAFEKGGLVFFVSCSLPACFSHREEETLSTTKHNTTQQTFTSLIKHKILLLIHKAQNATILFSLVRFINKQREEKERSI